ncbi:hypothetical protein INT45_012672 [Circinella minor]|uniref:Uncharacterized protein n=1 Tax=Circinella minor TaxID=1195481 RepID=A0A8H7VFU3_9FUNG|nr:hypothetical protein INT45_012672 [Circinella minor]
MLSSVTRRTLVTSATLRMATPISSRCYTIIPSTPQQEKHQPIIHKEDDHPNPIHALYNDTETMVDSSHSNQHLHSAPQHNMASDVFGSSSGDTFSPTFNTVFDE